MAYDHATGFFSSGGMAYDAEGERVRFVSRDEENNTEYRYDTLILHKEKVMYRVDLKTNKCNKTVPHRDWHPFGVHENSTFVGEFIVGSLERYDTGVLVNEWMHTFDNGTGVEYQQFTAHECVPVSRVAMWKSNETGSYHHYHSFYTDVKAGISRKDTFDVPKQCTALYMDF
jgi:hypothetical protein